MCESVVLQVGVVQDVPLDTVVGGEITEVDQSCSPDIWPAASPQSQHPGLLQHFPGKYFYIKIKNYPSHYSQFLLSPCRIPATVNTRRFAKKSPSSLHLYLSLYEVRGRRHQLPNT